MEMKISFPGGKKVTAEFNGRNIATDQPMESGGEGSAPTPYDYFLASLGTCAGFYVLSFCQERNIDTTGLLLTQQMEFTLTGEGRKKLVRVAIDILLPRGFPEKYRNAIVKAANSCSVKKTLIEPPELEITARMP